MDILAHSGGSEDGGSKESDPRKDTEAPFNTATPVTTQTSASQSPSTSLEAGGARGTDPEILFTGFLLQRPVSLRTLTSLNDNAESFSFSWTMNNNSANNVDINWIAWVARPAMTSSEADQVIVDNIIINPKMSAVNRERNFLSDDCKSCTSAKLKFNRFSVLTSTLSLCASHDHEPYLYSAPLPPPSPANTKNGQLKTCADR